MSPTAKEAISRNGGIVSAVSALELVTKHRLGKLPQADKAIREFWSYLAVDDFIHLPVSLEHGYRAGEYTIAHGDPFDRLLAAQAELEGLVLVTKDKAFAAFPCATRW